MFANRDAKAWNGQLMNIANAIAELTKTQRERGTPSIAAHLWAMARQPTNGVRVVPHFAPDSAFDAAKIANAPRTFPISVGHFAEETCGDIGVGIHAPEFVMSEDFTGFDTDARMAARAAAQQALVGDV